MDERLGFRPVEGLFHCSPLRMFMHINIANKSAQEQEEKAAIEVGVCRKSASLGISPKWIKKAGEGFPSPARYF